MSDDELIQAIDMILAGNKKEAQAILEDLVAREPENEYAWLWLGDCMISDADRKKCYYRVLELNPQNPKAQEKLDNLMPKAEEPSMVEILSRGR